MDIEEEMEKFTEGFGYKPSPAKTKIDMTCALDKAIHRIEDLGRIREKLSSLLDHELFSIFDKFGIGRAKDATWIFKDLSDERKDDLIHELAYGIEHVKGLICDCFFLSVGDREDMD